MIVEFFMPSDLKKGELRLKLLLEDENITISLDKSKEHKKMMKFTTSQIDVNLGEGLKNIVEYWRT